MDVPNVVQSKQRALFKPVKIHSFPKLEDIELIREDCCFCVDLAAALQQSKALICPIPDTEFPGCTFLPFSTGI